MRLTLGLLGLATYFSFLPSLVRADETTDRYVESLRAAGYADLAIDYLTMRLESKGNSAEETANLEFEVAASLIVASDAIDDLSKREQMLEEARLKFEEFSKKYPGHPKAPDALVQMATVDLQKGRLRVVQAQLPANASRAIALAREGRAFFQKSAMDYDKAQTRLQAAFKAMPIYISDEDAAGRALRARKTKLFEEYIEARFQGALAQFYLADSYKTIEIPPADPADKGAVAAAQKEREEWDRAYKTALEKARKGFEAIYEEHRRELVGLYGHLWMARCMAAQGEHRQAMGIYELLMEHENPDLARLQREVFYFQMISFAARKEYNQVINHAVPWLRNNAKFRLEPAYQGVQMELALAYVARAESATDGREQNRHYVEANSLFERLGSYSNAYTGLARREQLKISPFLAKSLGGRSFSQLFSLGNAKLDLLKPDLPTTEQNKILEEAKQLFRDAIGAARETDSVDSVNDARLALAYIHLRLEEIYEAAILCEYVARVFPKSTSAPQAALFGVTAYAWGFEKASELAETGVPARPDVDADHLVELAEYLATRWPSSKEVDDARATVGRLEMSRKNYERSTAAFDKVNPNSAKYPESLALAGGVFWDWYKSASREENASTKELEELRGKATDRLSRASPLLHAALGGVMDRQTFLNDAMLGEVYYESGEDDKALEVLLRLSERLKAGSVASEVEPPLRIGVLTTALQCYVRQNKLSEADGIIDLISAQQGQEETGNVTLVFISLAARLREQMARIKASGNAAQLRQLADSFESFLDRVAGRDAGQTIHSLVYLADNFIELERYAKAVTLLEKVIEHPEAPDEENRPSINRARLLLARSQAKLGDFAEARGTIDKLLRENMNAKDVIMERGEILDASGDLAESIKHWKWVVNRMKQGRPRPAEFYEAVDRLIATFLKVSGPDREKRLREGEYLASFLLQTDTSLPDEWRPIFEKHARELKGALGSY